VSEKVVGKNYCDTSLKSLLFQDAGNLVPTTVGVAAAAGGGLVVFSEVLSLSLLNPPIFSFSERLSLKFFYHDHVIA